MPRLNSEQLWEKTLFEVGSYVLLNTSPKEFKDAYNDLVTTCYIIRKTVDEEKSIRAYRFIQSIKEYLFDVWEEWEELGGVTEETLPNIINRIAKHGLGLNAAFIYKDIMKAYSLKTNKPAASKKFIEFLKKFCMDLNYNHYYQPYNDEIKSSEPRPLMLNGHEYKHINASMILPSKPQRKALEALN